MVVVNLDKLIANPCTDSLAATGDGWIRVEDGLPPMREIVEISDGAKAGRGMRTPHGWNQGGTGVEYEFMEAVTHYKRIPIYRSAPPRRELGHE